MVVNELKILTFWSYSGGKLFTFFNIGRKALISALIEGVWKADSKNIKIILFMLIFAVLFKLVQGPLHDFSR